MQLSENAIKVLEARYLRRDEDRRLVESPEEMFRRVASGLAVAEGRFAGPKERERWEERFFEALAALDFLPNSPTPMTAGTPLGQLSACFVLPVDDSMEGIFDSLKPMALVQQTGGGPASPSRICGRRAISSPPPAVRLGANETPDDREHFAECDPHACKL